jgi:hypothetical protein
MSQNKILTKHDAFYAHIQSLMTSVETKKPLEKEDYFRASSIHGMCPREQAISHKYKIDHRQKIGPDLWKTFKFGRVFEDFFRDKLLGDSKLLVGKWKCGLCEFSPAREERYAKPDSCEVCGAAKFEYVEEMLKDDVVGIGGHPDGFIEWQEQKYVLETKTTNNFNFSKVIAKPFDHHVAQTQIYMKLSEHNKALIWYFNKDTSKDICHQVDYDPNFVEFLMDKPRQYREYLNTGILPERICFNPLNTRAIKCSLCKLCFAQ